MILIKAILIFLVIIAFVICYCVVLIIYRGDKMKEMEYLKRELRNNNIFYYAICERKLYKTHTIKDLYIKEFTIYFKHMGETRLAYIRLVANSKKEYFMKYIKNEFRQDIKEQIQRLCVDFKIL